MATAPAPRTFVRRWTVRILWSAVLVFATIVIGGALDARRRLPDLQPWHRVVPPDVRARSLTNSSTLAELLAIEDQAFRTVRERIEDSLDPAWKVPANRYNRDGRSHPSRFATDWNRTQILVPTGEPIGGALLVHGLTDAPYSMRTIAEDLREAGYHVVALRVPGHGTVPAGLTDVTWEDWLAAVRVAARDIRGRIGPTAPLLLVGYSNGGAQVLKYALDVVEGSGDPQADRLVLLSPMIGVTPFAWLARVISLLGPVPAFEKARWLDVYPEYNPFKYTSFPANAGLQTWRLTTTMQAQIVRIAEAGRGRELPPILTFHSLVDATVSTPAIVHALYDVVADERSELVLFDINRSSGLVPFIQPGDAALVARLADETPRKFRRTLITNVDATSLEVVERTAAPGEKSIVTRPLSLSWPRDVYSLSHVAVPYPVTDPVYGRDDALPQPDTIRLGMLSPRGERAVLTVPSDTLTRLTFNPFFPYLHERLAGWIARAPVKPPGQVSEPPVTPAVSQGPKVEPRVVERVDGVPAWADRLRASDSKVRATAAGELAQGAPHALAVLRRLLTPEYADLHLAVAEIIRRIGPSAIPMLVDLLRHEEHTIRREAADSLIDLAPDTERIQPALRRALRDEDWVVAGDAARALGALGAKAAPSVQALVGTLSHDDPYVRIYAAEALASIGPDAAGATTALADALEDPAPGVRWAACEALGSIGPAAHPAVPQLIHALDDEFLYVRIFAAGALGSIGPKARSARGALRTAAEDPTLRHEAEWALRRIDGSAAGAAVTLPRPSLTLAALELPAPHVSAGHPPLEWDTTTGRNIVWSTELGFESFGRPVVAGDAVYVGTDNTKRLNPAIPEEAGVLMAFDAKDGSFVWQDVARRVDRGLREFLLPSTTGAPYVDGNRLYYVTADCQLRSLDTQGFRDGENDGPYRNEAFQDRTDADIVWDLDMCGRLGVFPHEATNSDVVPVGDLLMVSTSNGQNEGHTRVPSPRAPSLIAVDKRSGVVVWRAIGAGADVLHGQWSSPVAANVNGRIQVLFGGGDGWLRAFDAASGHEIWRFDGNPRNVPWLPRPGVFSRGAIIASPVFDGGRVFVAMGQSPGHGNAPSVLHAINPNGQRDVTGTRLLWTSRQVGRVVGTPVARDGLLYVGDLGGTIHCLDAATGALIWKHETNDQIWGSLLLTGDRLYVGNVGGTMTVLRAGRQKQLLRQIEMDAPIYSAPAVAGDALYVATANRLYRIAAR